MNRVKSALSSKMTTGFFERLLPPGELSGEAQEIVPAKQNVKFLTRNWKRDLPEEENRPPAVSPAQPCGTRGTAQAQEATLQQPRFVRWCSTVGPGREPPALPGSCIPSGFHPQTRQHSRPSVQHTGSPVPGAPLVPQGEALPLPQQLPHGLCACTPTQRS